MFKAFTRATASPTSATNSTQGRESDTVTDWLTVRGTIDAKDTRLHERTFKWLATLPRDIRPMATARQHPRVANRICDLWSHCEFTRLYLQGLLLDRRGGRKGFSEAVRKELEALQQYYFEHLSALPELLWNAVPLAEPKIPAKVFPPLTQQTEIEIRPL